MKRKDTYKRIVIGDIPYYGKHLVCSASGCKDTIRSIGMIEDFIKDLVLAINMTAFGEPIVARFGRDIEEGISAVQLIETSAITIHTNDIAKDMYLDVFSCKNFSEDTVAHQVETYFNPTTYHHTILFRR